MRKSCVVCHTGFDTHLRTGTCSDPCKTTYNRERKRRWDAENPDKVREIEKRVRVTRTANGKAETYRKARRSSKAGYIDRFMERVRIENPDTNLTREHLETCFGDVCAVTSVAFRYDRSIGSSFTNPYAPSIDRIDSSLPYQVGNIQIVLATVNFAKNAMTMSDFTQVWKDIVAAWAALTE